MQDKKQLLLIDGTAYIYRAFHAIPHLSNSKGLPTNAVYGFTRMLLKVIKDFKTDHMAVAFDVKGPSFRHKMYEEYKAHRPEMPDSLKPQIPYIKEVVRALNLPVLELQGYEADDIIGTISKHMKEKDVEVIIIAADKDMLQLIDENTTIVDTMKGKGFGIKEVTERFGTTPDRIVEIMGLAGDASDNIPGVKGIGEKTAVKLIKEFGTIENLLQNIERVKENGIKEKLREHAEDARLSRTLAVIDTNAPVDYKFEDLAVKSPDYPRLKELLRELEFTKLLNEIIPDEQPDIKGEYRFVTDIDRLKDLLTKVKEAGEAAIVIKKQEGAIFGELTGLAVCIKPGQAFYIPTGHCYLGAPPQIDRRFVIEAIKPIIEDEGIKKLSHDIKTVHIFFRQRNIQMMGANFDTSIASYLLNPSRPNYNIEDIAHEHLGHKMATFKTIAFEDVDVKAACDRACAEADSIFQISGKLLSQLEGDGLLNLFNEIEIPLSGVLAEMELNGIKVDRDYLVNLSKELEGRIEEVRSRIYAIAGAEFNINSPKQLASVLFEKLKLKPVKKTKKGLSTDEEVLMTLAASHELPAEILSFRQLSKLKSTYVDSILGLINPVTMRVHTSFNQTVTATGRLSSSEPNLQNIPIRTEFGNRIRRAFVADRGWLFLSADYSQIELRIVAHLSQDPLLIKAFKEDKDVHATTAAEIFGLMPGGIVTEDMRRRAKAINFGIIYGMGPYGLSAELGISQDEARGYIDEYFMHYKGIKAFIDKGIGEAVEKGYVTTLFGRRRHIPEIKSESEQVRRLGERIAINTSIQGTAADMIKIAMINISRKLKGNNYRSKMLLQIHDELIFEAPEAEIELLKGLVKKEMETAATLCVPVKVNIGIGNTWGELS